MSNIWMNLVLAVQLLSALAVIGLVLIQHGKGADMGASFGSGSSGSLFGATGSANFLSRSTAVAATLFFVCTLALAYLGTQSLGLRGNAAPTGGTSVLERGTTPPTPPGGAVIPGATPTSPEGSRAPAPVGSAPQGGAVPAAPSSSTAPAAPAAGASSPSATGSTTPPAAGATSGTTPSSNNGTSPVPIPAGK
jgi:preprotein translocase subunit SecG